MNTSLQSKLDMEKENHEDEVEKLKDENQVLTSSRDNFDWLYRHATNSLTTLKRNHQFTMEGLQRKRDQLKESEDEVSKLSSSLSSKEYTIKDLCASKKFLSQELDVAKHNIKVLQSDRVVLQAAYDKAMDKAIRAGRILMKRPRVVVPEDNVADVLAASGTVARGPAPSEPNSDSTPGDA